MWLIHLALRRPWTIIVGVVAVALCSVLALTRMRVDIFPNLNLPVIYVAQPYGGMSPAQMEGYLTYYYEYHFLYVNGIESVESKSVQGAALLKLTFHPGTNMSEALAQVIAYANRAHAFMPYGAVPPFIVRYDAGTVPVGYLTFSSPNRTLGEIQDLALNRIRPQFATLPGVSSPPPFGGNQRALVVSVDAEKLRAYGISPQQVIEAVTTGNVIIPAGNVQEGTLQPIVPSNSVVRDIQELADLPLRTGAGPTIFLHDIAKVDDSTDILAGYAEIDGKRAVYIPVTKRPDASTVTVVNEVRHSLDRFRALVPPDIQVDYRFDQSVYVKDSLWTIAREGLLGALLTGLMVLLFLGDWRSASIVVVTIPFSLISAVVLLWASGQTINIMTLGGLALAVGVLVDEGTVVIENIHTHLERQEHRALAVLEASREVLTPRLLAMLSILAVFIPSFFMTGVTQALFVPLSLAVGFAMAASYVLSGTLVPVLSNWVLPEHWNDEKSGKPKRRLLPYMRDRLEWLLSHWMPRRSLVIFAYLIFAAFLVGFVGLHLGQNLFPPSDSSQFQLRINAPIGTRVPVTEEIVRQVLHTIEQEAGDGNIESSLGYVGLQASSYPINTVYLWTSGPQEAIFRVALRPGAKIPLPEFQEKLRKVLVDKFPGSTFSFESGDIVSQIMNLGAPAPVEVAIEGSDLTQVRTYAARVRDSMSALTGLRDLRYEEPLEYPSINVTYDRVLVGQMGLTVQQVGNAILTATSSSRFVTPNYWADPKTGVGYQVQVEIPQTQIHSAQDIANIPAGSGAHPLVGDVANIADGKIIGEYDRINGRRVVLLSANIAGTDLGRVSRALNHALAQVEPVPRGLTVEVRGQIAPMRQTLTNLSVGLGIALLAILLLLTANFQSIRLALVALSATPAVLAGVVLMLWVTGTTLNIQSFMGAIMALGVAVANAILLVTFAEQYRRAGKSALDAAMEAAKTRMRPVLMTSIAMTAGMIPMALAIGSGAEATAPLGRAVIGGLLAATAATLLFIPLTFTIAQQNATRTSVSLDPEDAESRYAQHRKEGI
jgi:multidrug efflux pump subunit AcrB